MRLRKFSLLLLLLLASCNRAEKVRWIPGWIFRGFLRASRIAENVTHDEDPPTAAEGHPNALTSVNSLQCRSRVKIIADIFAARTRGVTHRTIAIPPVDAFNPLLDCARRAAADAVIENLRRSRKYGKNTHARSKDMQKYRSTYFAINLSA